MEQETRITDVEEKTMYLAPLLVAERLKPGATFTGKNGAFDGTIVVQWVADTRIGVQCSLPDSTPWVEEWRLDHTVGGFLRGDYVFTGHCEDGTDVLTGAEHIMLERAQQFRQHGHMVAGDVTENENEELLTMARAVITRNARLLPNNWPVHTWQKIMAKDRVGQLRVAGALIAAEIDRLQEQKPTKP